MIYLLENKDLLTLINKMLPQTSTENPKQLLQRVQMSKLNFLLLWKEEILWKPICSVNVSNFRKTVWDVFWTSGNFYVTVRSKKTVSFWSQHMLYQFYQMSPEGKENYARGYIHSPETCARSPEGGERPKFNFCNGQRSLSPPLSNFESQNAKWISYRLPVSPLTD